MMMDGMVVSQTTAIINLISAKAGTDGRGDAQSFALSQMFVAGDEGIISWGPACYKCIDR